jgi:hypothetical protein
MLARSLVEYAGENRLCFYSVRLVSVFMLVMIVLCTNTLLSTTIVDRGRGVAHWKIVIDNTNRLPYLSKSGALKLLSNSGPAPVRPAVFLYPAYPCIFCKGCREWANITPARGISPPSVGGFKAPGSPFMG